MRCPVNVKQACLLFATVVAVACHRSAVGAWKLLPLRAMAQTSITMRDTTPMLSTTVTVKNTGSRPVQVEYGLSAVRILAYRDESRSGRPVWNSDFRAPYHSTSLIGYVTLMPLIGTYLGPGKTLDLGGTVPLIELVGDSLPNGRYYFAADLEMSRQPQLLHLPAGAADVVVNRAP